jgi:hypothetical protein
MTEVARSGVPYTQASTKARAEVGSGLRRQVGALLGQLGAEPRGPERSHIDV